MSDRHVLDGLSPSSHALPNDALPARGGTVSGMSHRFVRALVLTIGVLVGVAVVIRKATADTGGSYDPDRPEASR